MDFRGDNAMRFSKIIKKLNHVGFDEFYQAGSRSRFHPLNIVAKSQILNLQFWVCVEGGYNVMETYHIATRPLDDMMAPTERINFKTQTELIAGLEDIRQRIANAIQENELLQDESKNFLKKNKC